MNTITPQTVKRENYIDLTGRWEVLIDFNNEVKEISQLNQMTKWQPLNVPGCWEQIESNKLAEGPVWYKKRFLVPHSWNNSPASLSFEGVNYFCEIWVNGKEAGTHEGGWNGFEINVTDYIVPESENEVVLKVYKQGEKYPVRECLAGFFPDVGVVFGGIWKPVALKKTPEIKINDIFIKPRIKEKQIITEYKVETVTAKEHDSIIRLTVFDPNGNIAGNKEETLPFSSTTCTYNTAVPMNGPLALWDMESPELYKLKVEILVDDKTVNITEETFGMREVTILGDQIYLNGKSIYLRGVLHWGWYGDHIAPTPTEEEIRNELQHVKESGFNLVKHCLYIPTKEYLQIADEMGILIWQELPMWLPEVNDEFEKRVFYQYERIISEIRNHPSIIMWTLGCELNHQVNASFLETIFNKAKKLTDNAVIRDNSGSGECYGGLLKEHADFYDYHFYNDIHFYRDLINQFAGSWREKKPWLFGEFCDYDTYRNLDGIREHFNGELPWWLKDDLQENPGSKETRWHWYRQEEKMSNLNLPFTNKDLAENSIRSAFAYRKAVLELVRSYQQITGYVLTSIKGNPIATSSIFDDFGMPNHEPDCFQSFNEETILTLTWDNRRNWVNGGDRLINWDHFNYFSGEEIRPHIFLSHYGDEPIINTCLQWNCVQENGLQIANGSVEIRSFGDGEAKELGVAEFFAPEVTKPMKLIFQAELEWEGKTIKNRWSFWVFPNILQPKDFDRTLIDDPLHLLNGLLKRHPSLSYEHHVKEISDHKSVIVTTMLRPDHYRFMEEGGKVVYIQRGEGEFPINKVPFWRESIQLFYSHPLMNLFPHEQHTGLAFYGIATDTAFDFHGMEGFKPIMGRLDARTFELSHYMAQKEIGKGLLIATTLRFEGGLGAEPDGIDLNPAGSYWLESLILKNLHK
ncbi:glycoside hydrolase family 2 protein [Pseudalkalibacillus caeni]|uniref:Uncharacterized protein n=1 Tax=Exobacillus caeni TaxID=2574798 RepID=A0A5R9FBX0_9BACL|nr:sugar-binding domain-containing protein [Pseudalkalibacillus caeni]TLS38383.1 hypothetical protein FCL54_04370 [Pseudalkalibacillus caeni]